MTTTSKIFKAFGETAKKGFKFVFSGEKATKKKTTKSRKSKTKTRSKGKK
jgi:hypothetical protein